MDKLDSIVQLSEMMMDTIMHGPLAVMMPVCIMLAACSFVTQVMRQGRIEDSILTEPLHREKLTREDIETIEAELEKLEDPPESTYRENDTYCNAPDPEPAPAKKVKMVTCKHCLGTKPNGGKCPYCGLG